MMEGGTHHRDEKFHPYFSLIFFGNAFRPFAVSMIAPLHVVQYSGTHLKGAGKGWETIPGTN